MTTLLSNETDAARAKHAVEEAIGRLAGATETSPDLRTRVSRAGSRLGGAGHRIVDTGKGVVGTGAETARTVAREASSLPAAAHDVAARARGVASDLASSLPIRVQVGKPPRRPLLPFALLGLAAAAVGALAAWLFDPQMGRSRRAVAGDRAAATARRAGRWSARQRGRIAANVSALRERMRSSGDATESRDSLDEVDLANKVRTELFRDSSIDKGAINVNAERDVVFLRGTGSTEDQIREIVRLVEGIAGVRKVVNLLHVPGAPVPVMASDDDTSNEPGSDRPSWAVPH